MVKNMGIIDRAVRISLALIGIALIVAQVITGVWAVVVAIAAAIFLGTSTVSFCPLYKIFGISTQHKEDRKQNA